MKRRRFAKAVTGVIVGSGSVLCVPSVRAQEFSPRITRIDHDNRINIGRESKPSGEPVGGIKVTVETEDAATTVVELQPDGLDITLSAPEGRLASFVEQNRAIFSSPAPVNFTHTLEVDIVSAEPGATCDIVAWVSEEEADRSGSGISGPATRRENADDEETSSFEILVEGSTSEDTDGTSIQGLVVSGAECPIEGATIRLPLPDDELTTTTNSNGEYTLDLSGVSTPDEVTLFAEKQGYITESTIAYPGETADFTLTPGDESQVVISPEIHHLGDGSYDGSINSRFQEPVEASELTQSFELTETQVTANEAELIYSIRGAEENNEVRINDELVGNADTAPSDGSASEQSLSVDSEILERGENNLTVVSVENPDSIIGEDIDDFEISNIRLVLIDPDIGDDTSNSVEECPSDQPGSAESDDNSDQPEDSDSVGEVPTVFRDFTDNPGMMGALLGGGGLLGVAYLTYRSRSSNSKEESGHCPECGSDMDPAEVFCGSCGAQLAEERRTQEKEGITGTETKEIRRISSYDELSINKVVENGPGYQIRDATVDGSGKPAWVVTPFIEGAETLNVTQTKEFLKETEPWAKMDTHPNLLSVYGYGEEPLPWLAIEPANYPTALERVDELSQEERINILTQVCEAVHHAHRYGITYRNLDASSVLLAENTIIRLRGPIDQLDEVTHSFYSAPEELNGEATDQTLVYRVGVTAYALFTDTLPYEDSSGNITETVRHVEPIPPIEHSPDIPEDLNDTILKALSKSHEERHETVLHLRDELTNMDMLE